MNNAMAGRVKKSVQMLKGSSDPRPFYYVEERTLDGGKPSLRRVLYISKKTGDKAKQSSLQAINKHIGRHDKDGAFSKKARLCAGTVSRGVSSGEIRFDIHAKKGVGASQLIKGVRQLNKEKKLGIVGKLSVKKTDSKGEEVEVRENQLVEPSGDRKKARIKKYITGINDLYGSLKGLDSVPATELERLSRRIAKFEEMGGPGDAIADAVAFAEDALGELHEGEGFKEPAPKRSLRSRLRGDRAYEQLDGDDDDGVKVTKESSTKRSTQKTKTSRTAKLDHKAQAAVEKNTRAVVEGLGEVEQDVAARASEAITALASISPTQLKAALQQHAEAEVRAKTTVKKGGKNANIETQMTAGAKVSEALDAQGSVGLDTGLLGLKVMASLGVNIKAIADVEGSSEVNVSLFEDQLLDALTHINLKVLGRAETIAEAEALASGEARLGLKGAALKGYAKAQASIQAKATGTTSFSIGALKLSTDLEAMVGAKAVAEAGGTFEFKPTEGTLVFGYTAGAEASAEATATLSSGLSLKGRRLTTQTFALGASVGVGASIKGSFAIKKGKITISHAAAADVEAGLSAKVITEIDTVAMKAVAIEITKDVALAVKKRISGAQKYDQLEDIDTFRAKLLARLIKLKHHRRISCMALGYEGATRSPRTVLSAKTRKQYGASIASKINEARVQSMIDGAMKAEKWAALYKQEPDAFAESIAAAVMTAWSAETCKQKYKHAKALRSGQLGQPEVIVDTSGPSPRISLDLPAHWLV